MGCCNSTPVGDDERAPAVAGRPARGYSPTRGVASTSAIVDAVPVTQSRSLQPPSLNSRGTASHSNLSTPRHSSVRPVALHEHYNLPLLLPTTWRSDDRTWTHSELERERSEFFETRVTGRQEIWGALKTVTELLREGELANAQGILEAAGVTTPTGSLTEGCYDEAGNLYRIPEAIILDPTNVVPGDIQRARPISNIDGETMAGVEEAKSAAKEPEDQPNENEEDLEAAERRREEKGKGTERDAIKVRCRLSDRGGPDVVVMLGKTQNVGALTRRVHAEAEVRLVLESLLDCYFSGLRCNLGVPKIFYSIACLEEPPIMLTETLQIPPSMRLRIAYLGKMLNAKETLEKQGWKEGHVVNALVTGSPEVEPVRAPVQSSPW